MGKHRGHWVPALALLLAGVIATAAATAGTDQPAVAAEDAKVVMYVTQDCGYCKKARALLTQRHVRWEERDILASAQAKAEWQARGGRGTPVIVIGDAVIHGVDEARIDSALAARLP